MILIAPNQPGFPDLTELLEAPPCRSPAESICYPRWRARYGTQTWNYGAIMCNRFRGMRGVGRLTVSHAHGSAKTLYKTFVCFKMGVFVKESGSYRPDYLHRILCSAFDSVPGTAVSLSGRDWNTCLNHCLPPSKDRDGFAVSSCY